MSWTDERKERVRRMWDEGGSASEIAAVLGGGTTRNAVIGVVHRMGLPGRRALRPRGEVKPPEKPKRVPTPSISPVSGQSPVRPDVPQELVDAFSTPAITVPEPSRGRVTLVQLTATTCRWPIGDPAKPDFRFCGEVAPVEKPYCCEHAQRAVSRVVAGEGRART